VSHTESDTESFFSILCRNIGINDTAYEQRFSVRMFNALYRLLSHTQLHCYFSLSFISCSYASYSKWRCI